MSLLHQTRRILVYVQDLGSAVRFYENALGFTPTVGLEGVNQEFATSGPPLVLHASAPSQELHGMSGFVPSFEVADIASVVARLKTSGVRTVMDLTEVAHGWIYFFADIEGNVIQVYEPKQADPAAIEPSAAAKTG